MFLGEYCMVCWHLVGETLGCAVHPYPVGSNDYIPSSAALFYLSTVQLP